MPHPQPIFGAYAVTASGAVANKYSFIYEDGSLVLSGPDRAVDYMGAELHGVGVGEIVDLNASASSNLAVQYSVSDSTVAELAVTNGSLKAWWKWMKQWGCLGLLGFYQSLDPAQRSNLFSRQVW